jgi:DNA-binding GntR family transcriptional regulator
VTPVREALSQLEQAGIIGAIPNRGFFIPALSIREAEEIYPIIAHMESAAVKNSRYTIKQLDKLRNIQLKFEKATKAEELVNLDLAFHDALIHPFDNNTVKRLLSDLKIRIFFYELIYMESTSYLNRSVNQHDQIIDFIATGHSWKASKLLLQNWYVSLEYIKEYLIKEDSSAHP